MSPDMIDASPESALGVVASLGELIAMRAHGSAGPLHRATIGATAPGNHPSRRTSRGMEFAETRPYQSGDDVRTLDWRQTARRGRPYTKLFQQEHERPLQLLVDLGPSMRFGTRVAFKSVLAARAAALLAWRALAGGDRVGGLVCNGAELQMIRPQSRHHGVLELLACLARVSATPPAAAACGLAAPLHSLARSLRPGSLIVVLSDFTALDAETERRLAALALSAELVLLHVYDEFEAQAPPPGHYQLTDGQRHLGLDLRAAPARTAYGAAFAERRRALERLARRSGATLVPLATHMALQQVLRPTLLQGPLWRLTNLRLAP